MQLLTNTIEKIRKQIVDSRSPFLDELAAIEEDFHRMAEFFCQGNSDPLADNVYADLRKRCDKLQRNIRYYGLVHGNPFFQKVIQSTGGDYVLDLEELQGRLEDFSVDLSMLELETDAADAAAKRKNIYAKHHEYRSRMFAKVMLTNGISEENAEGLLHIILSSSVDSVDSHLLVAALMLSCMNVFEPRKAEILYNVYANAQQKSLSQKALVAFVICSSVKCDSFDLARYPIPPSLLATVQQQLLYTLDSPRVEKIMQSEIMPDIIKNSEFDFKNNRIVKRKLDKIEDIINPNRDEEAMEKMEEVMRKMKQMQEQGSDLFFGGFRYVKQHPFFNLVPNWLCPFYFDHPQLPVFANPDDRNIVINMMDKTPFCESDKYSFVISMHKAIATIPEQMKEMLRLGQAELGIVGGGDIKRNEAFMRRIFLQDIFRFFKLCHWAKYLYNPLSPAGNSLIITNYLAVGEGEYDTAAISVCRTLRKLGFTEECASLLSSWSPKTVEGKVFKAFCLMNNEREERNDTGYSCAVDLLEEALRQDSHNVQALFGITKACFLIRSKRRFEPYQKDALNSLLALHFKNESDISVIHNLVKAYLLNGENDKAVRYACMLVEKGKAEPFALAFLGLHRVSCGDSLNGVKDLVASKERPDRLTSLAALSGINLPTSQLDMILHLMRYE